MAMLSPFCYRHGGKDMFLFITMFICNMLMPLIMLICGYCMYNNPPKEINGVIGYRTKMSKLNKDTWTFLKTEIDFCLFFTL